MSDLAIPSKVLDQHLVCLGKTGAGKSSVLRHIVEHLLSHKKRVCIIDPKGDWWGLKLSGDGKSEGFQVITFGDFKEPKATDIPVNDRSGKHVAELIVSGNRPCIIGCRGWMPSAQGRFWIDFASTVFNSNQSGGLNLVIDEIQNYAPKELAGFGEENMALYWMKKILSEGRGLGITVFCGSQRPQSVHNGVLTQCETLVGMRLTHDADCKAVENWLKRTRDKAKREEVLISIPEMARGEGWVWSPEIGFGPERVKFPMFHTFDSFAPPQQQKKVALSDWSSVDLEEVKTKLASVVEEAKANDPAELKREIAKLRKELATKPTDTKRVATLTETLRKEHETKKEAWQEAQDLKQRIASLRRSLEVCMKFIVEISTHNFEATAVKDDIKSAIDAAVASSLKIIEGKLANRCKEFDTLKSQASKLLNQMRDLLSEDVKVSVAVRHNEPFSVSPQPIKRTPVADDSNGELSGGARSILIAAAQHPQGVSDEQIAVLTGYKKTSRATFKQRLTNAGYIEPGGFGFKATELGIAALGNDYEPLPTGEALREYWLRRLSGGELTVFRDLIQVYPNVAPRQELEERTAYKKTSLATFCQRLSARRLIESTRDGVKANPELFE